MEKKCETCRFNGKDDTQCLSCDNSLKSWEAKDCKEDMVNHPNHYTNKKIECIDIIGIVAGDKFTGFLIGNVLKYLYRHEDKGGIQDLKKARWYLDKLIAVKEGEAQWN